MRKDLHAERAAKKLAAIMQQYGKVAVPEVDIKTVAKEAAYSKKSDVPKYLEIEAALLFLEKPARFILKNCKREACKEPFAASYHAVAYCSDNCRSKDFQSQTGIQWNPNKSPEERWGGEPPLVVPPAVLMKLKSLAEFFFGPELVVRNQNETQQGDEEQVPDSLAPIFSAVEEEFAQRGTPEPEIKESPWFAAPAQIYPPVEASPTHNHPQSDVPVNDPDNTTVLEQPVEETPPVVQKVESVFDFE